MEVLYQLSYPGRFGSDEPRGPILESQRVP